MIKLHSLGSIPNHIPHHVFRDSFTPCCSVPADGPENSALDAQFVDGVEFNEIDLTADPQQQFDIKKPVPSMPRTPNLIRDI
jgi:hypothetical protein